MTSTQICIESDIKVASENAFIVYFRGNSLRKRNILVSRYVNQLEALDFSWIVELVPAFDSVLVLYEALHVDHLYVYSTLKKQLLALKEDFTQLSQQNTELSEFESGDMIEIPVYYSPPIEHDIKRIASHNQLSEQDVIERHQRHTYRVYCLGFSPGFGFLGEVDASIETPRLAQPRKKVPAGAVAIADRQTAVYPSISPGGWNIIGLCPLKLFDPEADSPTLLKIGDQVRFKSISQREFLQLGGQW